MVTHRAVSAARGFILETILEMIDDDFESEFRKMIEHFMGSMGFSPKGEISVKTWRSTFPGDMNPAERMPAQSEMHAEEIDLGESYLILIDTVGNPATPEIRVENRAVQVRIGEDTQTFTVDFDIDLKESAASYRNGILEIIVQKDENGKEKENTGTIHIE